MNIFNNHDNTMIDMSTYAVEVEDHHIKKKLCEVLKVFEYK